MSEFVRDTEPYRRELIAHCYRMLGSAHDAEDVVQETYLRAWRGYPEFENRSSVRTWLYRVATNACLTTLAHGSRRVLPSGLGGPADDPHSEPEPAPNVTWLQVIPDSWVDDPAVVVTSRESLRLALVASLQHLPAQQRAVLLLRDVLAFPAPDVAAMLDISVAAVKSALQRARARMQDVAPSADEVIEPTERRARELLEQYMTAFENADTALLAEALRHDAALEMVGSRTWFGGRATCLPYLAGVVGVQGDWRMVVHRRQRPARRCGLSSRRRWGAAGVRDRGARRDGDRDRSHRRVRRSRPGHAVRLAADRFASGSHTLVDRTVAGARHHDIVARYAGELN
jgi:RNA polymerase sigma-70 factor (ECF subfamily)